MVFSLFFAVAAGVIWGGCASVQGSGQEEQNRLQIGWAKRSIAAPGNVPISGQMHLRVAYGEYTPVIASALAMSNAKDAVIFVSLDVVSANKTILRGIVDILKKEAPEIPASKIILNATHTHTGPATAEINIKYPNKVDIAKSKDYQGFIIRNTADAIKAAWKNRAPGSIAYGYGFATVGFSRRSLYLDDTGKRIGHRPGFASNGHCIMYGKTHDDMFAGYEAGTDAFINLLYTFDAKGKLNGAVVNVPCPAQNFEKGWMYYAGFWANVRRKLEAEYGDIGLICQSAAAGDLAPRQLHYNEAEYRRYMLKYPGLVKAYQKNPMRRPDRGPASGDALKYEILEVMRAEDAANRITAAFNEVLLWAAKDKDSSPVLKHDFKTVKLDRCMLPESILKQEQIYHKKFMKQSFLTEGDKWQMLISNSALNAHRNKIVGVINRFEQQKKDTFLETGIHVVRIGDVAFATNRFELFLDYMHRIQGRSPFVQTFIVQLVTDHNSVDRGVGTYLATERGEKNKGYGATPYSCIVSPAGGQQLVDHTVQMLREIRALDVQYDKKGGEFRDNPEQPSLKLIVIGNEIRDIRQASAGTGIVSVNGKYHERIAELTIDKVKSADFRPPQKLPFGNTETPPVITLKLLPSDTEKLGKFTEAHVGRQAAVYALGEYVFSATICEKISGGALQISNPDSSRLSRIAERFNIRAQ